MPQEPGIGFELALAKRLLSLSEEDFTKIFAGADINNLAVRSSSKFMLCVLS